MRSEAEQIRWTDIISDKILLSREVLASVSINIPQFKINGGVMIASDRVHQASCNSCVRVDSFRQLLVSRTSALKHVNLNSAQADTI